MPTPTSEQTRLKMDAVTTTPLANPADSQFRANADMNNFKVNLFGFVIIWFELLKFASEKGQKPDVSVRASRRRRRGAVRRTARVRQRAAQPDSVATVSPIRPESR